MAKGYGRVSMAKKFGNLLQQLPKLDDRLWEQKRLFITPYTLDECLRQLQEADKRHTVSSLRWKWIEDKTAKRTGLSFNCKTTRSRISLGLTGQIDIQAQPSNQVHLRIGMLYSHAYFFLTILLAAPIFLASGTPPNLLTSYLLSLVGTYVVFLIVGFILATVLIAVNDIASQELFNDLKSLLKGT